MNKIRVKAPAKINLTLDITGRREDGYHTVKMIMQTVTLFDEITIMRNHSKALSLSCNFHYVPTDKRNAAFKAALAFFEKTGIVCDGIHIKLKKKIPAQSGLAGGSADAAGTLVALNELYNAGLNTDELCELGKRTGADIPFCIVGGTRLCEGIGEIMTPLPELPHCSIVIVRPPRGASTPEVYRLYDLKNDCKHPDTASCIEALEDNDLKCFISKAANVLEPVTTELVPAIRDIKNRVLDSGAIGAQMTGSGTAVFGIFDDRDKARHCYGRFKSVYKDVFLVSPYKKGVTII